MLARFHHLRSVSQKVQNPPTEGVAESQSPKLGDEDGGKDGIEG